MSSKTYTLEEINSKINKIHTKLDNLLLKRKQINKDINNTIDKLYFWEELDESQYKLFNDE